LISKIKPPELCHILVNNHLRKLFFILLRKGIDKYWKLCYYVFATPFINPFTIFSFYFEHAVSFQTASFFCGKLGNISLLLSPVITNHLQSLKQPLIS